jgi:hypothetical protein
MTLTMVIISMMIISMVIIATTVGMFFFGLFFRHRLNANTENAVCSFQAFSFRFW